MVDKVKYDLHVRAYYRAVRDLFETFTLDDALTNDLNLWTNAAWLAAIRFRENLARLAAR